LNQVSARLREDLAREEMDLFLIGTDISQIDRDLAATPATLEGAPGSGTGGIPNPAYQALIASRTGKAKLLADSTALAAALEGEISRLEDSATQLGAKLAAAQNEEAVVKANVSRLESTLNLLSSKMVEAQMAHSVNLGETTIAVVSPAMEPSSPVKPRKMVNMAVAGVLGGFVSVLLVFVLEYMDNTVKTQEDVSKYLSLGTLGAIPVMESRQRRKK